MQHLKHLLVVSLPLWFIHSVASALLISFAAASGVRGLSKNFLSITDLTVKLGTGSNAHVRGLVWGDWATRTAIASHFKCHLGGDIMTGGRTLAWSHPIQATIAWIKVTGCVLCLPAAIVVAVISRQAVRDAFPRRPADTNNQQVCVWSAIAADVLSWNKS